MWYCSVAIGRAQQGHTQQLHGALENLTTHAKAAYHAEKVYGSCTAHAMEVDGVWFGVLKLCVLLSLPQVEHLTEQLCVWKDRARRLDAELRQQQQAQQQASQQLQELQAQHQVAFSTALAAIPGTAWLSAKIISHGWPAVTETG